MLLGFKYTTHMLMKAHKSSQKLIKIKRIKSFDKSVTITLK